MSLRMRLASRLKSLQGPNRPADCHEVGTRLQQFLDDEVTDRRRDAIAAHLEDCRRCGLEADTYMAVKDSLRRGRRDVAPGTIDRLRTFSEQLRQPD